MACVLPREGASHKRRPERPVAFPPAVCSRNSGVAPQKQSTRCPGPLRQRRGRAVAGPQAQVQPRIGKIAGRQQPMPSLGKLGPHPVERRAAHTGHPQAAPANRRVEPELRRGGCGKRTDVADQTVLLQAWKVAEQRHMGRRPARSLGCKLAAQRAGLPLQRIRQGDSQDQGCGRDGQFTRLPARWPKPGHAANRCAELRPPPAAGRARQEGPSCSSSSASPCPPGSAY
jgi:hypothetical protein